MAQKTLQDLHDLGPNQPFQASPYTKMPDIEISSKGIECLLKKLNPHKKVQVGKDQEKAQSEKDSHSKNRGGKKPNQQSGTYTMKHIVSRMSSYFPNRWPLSYLNLTKNMKTYIRRQQHKKIFKHQDIKRKEPPQKYRLGTISNTKLLAGLNRFYMAITSPSASAVVHNI